MLEKFYPGEYLDSTYVIDFEKLYQEGYRGLIFDIDNTLVPHGAPADERAKALFARLKAIGFRCCLISNNQKPRVEMVQVKISRWTMFIMRTSHQPGIISGRWRLWDRQKEFCVYRRPAFLPIYGGAKNAGLRNILVKPINPKEEIQIVLKRYLEKIVLHFYTKEEKNS